MRKILSLLAVLLIFSEHLYAKQVDPETKKSHLEDIFIWKISDELKLSVEEEKKFTEITKSLNKKKSEINKKIQKAVQELSQSSADSALNKYKKLIQDYNQISIIEFDSVRNLLGRRKFVDYLKIKNELTGKIKSVLISDKASGEKNETPSGALPPPKIFIEKND